MFALLVAEIALARIDERAFARLLAGEELDDIWDELLVQALEPGPPWPKAA